MKNTPGHPKAHGHDRLRHNAEELIEKGVAPRTSRGALGIDALTLLYESASTPETAADALKLLHELRTHQVELDLLYEQLQANEYEITEELAYYKSLYDLAPAAYLIVANDGQIIEGNQAAGVLFGECDTALTGKALSAYLAPGQEGAVNRLLQRPGEQASTVQATGKALVELPDRRHLTISARHPDAGDSVLMILTETTENPARS
jgi:PAS domain S-box-containing protein